MLPRGAGEAFTPGKTLHQCAWWPDASGKARFMLPVFAHPLTEVPVCCCAEIKPVLSLLYIRAEV